MITQDHIIRTVSETLGVQNDPDEVARLKRMLNALVVSTSEKHSFHLLRRKVTYDLADASTTEGEEGIWLPGNLAGVDAVQDVSTGVYYTRRDMDSIDQNELYRPRYSLYKPDLPVAFWSEDLRIEKGSTTIESTALDNDGEDYTGEWVRLGNEPGIYNLTGERTISPTYWGESIEDGDLTIRPENQKKLIVHIDHDTQVTTGEVIVHYWVYHAPMYRPGDICQFPNQRWIELLLMKEARGSLGRRSRDPINADLDDEWKEVLRLNPAFQIPNNPVDRLGRAFTNTRELYTRRR